MDGTIAAHQGNLPLAIVEKVAKLANSQGIGAVWYLRKQTKLVNFKNLNKPLYLFIVQVNIVENIVHMNRSVGAHNQKIIVQSGLPLLDGQFFAHQAWTVVPLAAASAAASSS